ncbi:hypothetical protein CTheo_5249 [Ceratobasidium theobromae]|uniref:Methyltransferase domain containing protein n=1 Tax=Ceratobasidium theobromae TaxID=1582974 RepID=A0A5N5QHT7_9AGAM|nr:hypothetical protein CTheo_5249 [Ceratobasidium theobromae]
MPVEQLRPDAWDDAAVYWAGYPEDEDFSDVGSLSSETTARSMSTLSSFEVSSYFREIYGRMYPADTNIPPFVPLDNGEAARLELQHYYLKLMIGSNYFGPVNSILQPHPLRRKRVLDVFTADGTWAQEMATEFPHVDFVSLDMVPLVPHTPRANVIFEVYDVYNGLAEPDASFDMVHTRRTVSQITDYPAFMREIHRVLRPGGLLLFGQLEVEVYEYTGPNKSTPNDPGETLYPGPHVIQAPRSLQAMSRGMRLLRDSLISQSVSINMWRELPDLLVPDSSLWRIPPRELKSDNFEEGQPHMRVPHTPGPGGYRDIVVTTHILPTTSWHSCPRLRALGDVVQQVGEWDWKNFGLLFRQHGLNEKEADALIEAGMKERTSVDIWQVMRYHTIYATKI